MLMLRRVFRSTHAALYISPAARLQIILCAIVISIMTLYRYCAARTLKCAIIIEPHHNFDSAIDAVLWIERS